MFILVLGNIRFSYMYLFEYQHKYNFINSVDTIAATAHYSLKLSSADYDYGINMFDRRFTHDWRFVSVRSDRESVPWKSSATGFGAKYVP